MIRFHGIAKTDVKLIARARKRLQATREAFKHPAIMPNGSAPAPTTVMEAPPAERPSLVVKISHRRKPSQEVRLPQDTKASAPHTSTTLGTDALTLEDKKPASKKRSQRRKAGANDMPLKQRKQQNASMFEDKTNF